MTFKYTALACSLAAALALTACGNDDKATTATDNATPATSER
ncbi:Uncharacterised protein [Moraxella lacunata]|uniref:Uncharacterized protein n=1 Tax=Moraxella lacunata TaxID=477 RepID=A0A378QG25_MORLA|nr:hypothetical protein [Moraxella lacunata]STY99631.1 Uncharacterised protein [Moraxella lacunata]